MDSPDAALLSPVSDIALVSALSNLAGEEVNGRLKCWADDKWQALESLAHDAVNDLIPISATFPFKMFLAEKIQGFDPAICKLEAAVAAIVDYTIIKVRAVTCIIYEIYCLLTKGKQNNCSESTKQYSQTKKAGIYTSPLDYLETKGARLSIIGQKTLSHSSILPRKS